MHQFACNMQNMQNNMHDMQNMQTSLPICRICTAHFADVPGPACGTEFGGQCTIRVRLSDRPSPLAFQIKLLSVSTRPGLRLCHESQQAGQRRPRRGQWSLAASDSDPPSGQLPPPGRRPLQGLTRTRLRSHGPKPKVGAESVPVTPRGPPSAPGLVLTNHSRSPQRPLPAAAAAAAAAAPPLASTRIRVAVRKALPACAAAAGRAPLSPRARAQARASQEPRSAAAPAGTAGRPGPPPGGPG